MSTSNPSVKMELDALRIYPGATMYIQSQSDDTHTRHKVQFIGSIKGKSLLVTLPFEHGKGLWMQAGHTFVLRGFNGIYAYAFSAQVIRPRAHPFPYIHFSWPNSLDCQRVRKSLRVEVALSGNIIQADSHMVAVTLLDLSMSGSMLDSPSALGAPGDGAEIVFTVDFEENQTELKLAVIIRNIHTKVDGSGFRVGIGFEKLSQNDALILHYVTNNIALAGHF